MKRQQKNTEDPGAEQRNSSAENTALTWFSKNSNLLRAVSIASDMHSSVQFQSRNLALDIATHFACSLLPPSPTTSFLLIAAHLINDWYYRKHLSPNSTHEATPIKFLKENITLASLSDAEQTELFEMFYKNAFIDVDTHEFADLTSQLLSGLQANRTKLIVVLGLRLIVFINTIILTHAINGSHFSFDFTLRALSPLLHYLLTTVRGISQILQKPVDSHFDICGTALTTALSKAGFPTFIIASDKQPTGFLDKNGSFHSAFLMNLIFDNPLNEKQKWILWSTPWVLGSYYGKQNEKTLVAMRLPALAELNPWRYIEVLEKTINPAKALAEIMDTLDKTVIRHFPPEWKSKRGYQKKHFYYFIENPPKYLEDDLKTLQLPYLSAPDNSKGLLIALFADPDNPQPCAAEVQAHTDKLKELSQRAKHRHQPGPSNLPRLVSPSGSASGPSANNSDQSNEAHEPNKPSGSASDSSTNNSRKGSKLPSSAIDLSNFQGNYYKPKRRENAEGQSEAHPNHTAVEASDEPVFNLSQEDSMRYQENYFLLPIEMSDHAKKALKYVYIPKGDTYTHLQNYGKFGAGKNAFVHFKLNGKDTSCIKTHDASNQRFIAFPIAKGRYSQQAENGSETIPVLYELHPEGYTHNALEKWTTLPETFSQKVGAFEQSQPPGRKHKPF